MRGLAVAMCLACSVAVADPKSPDFLAGYRADPAAKTIAQALYDDYGDIATAGEAEIMDGGYRGKIRLVPELPIKTYRKQLEWVASAMADIDDFFAHIEKPKYRWKQLTFRFVRSVGKRTPSAYATGWTITHNVVGSLLTSAAGVRETYFHELFHLNDFDHGNWSSKTLAKDYAAIVKQCGIPRVMTTSGAGRRPAAEVKCLEPYAPNTTKVRASGTYYAFQPNNGDGVHEYAAELAVRYFKEQSEMRTKGKLSRKAFKCGPAANARAWQAIVDEFFAGRDLIPAC